MATPYLSAVAGLMGLQQGAPVASLVAAVPTSLQALKAGQNAVLDELQRVTSANKVCVLVLS